MCAADTVCSVLLAAIVDHLFVLKVDFQELQAQSEAEQRRSQEREDRQRALLQQRLDEVLQEMRGKRTVGIQ